MLPHIVIFQLWVGLGSSFYQPHHLDSFVTRQECEKAEVKYNEEYQDALVDIVKLKCVPVEIGGKYD